MIENAEEFTNYYLYGENRERISGIKINIYKESEIIYYENNVPSSSSEPVLIKTLGEEDENGQSDLIANTFSYTEGLTEESKLKFGSFVLPQIKIERIYNGVSYKGNKCKVFQDLFFSKILKVDEVPQTTDEIELGVIYAVLIGNDIYEMLFWNNNSWKNLGRITEEEIDSGANFIYKRLVFLDGYIVGEEFNDDHSIVTMTIGLQSKYIQYDENISDLIDLWLFGGDIPLSEFVFNVFNVAGFYFNTQDHIDYFKYDSTNEYYINNFITEDSEITILDMLRMIGELFGVFFRFKKYIKFCDENNFYGFSLPQIKFCDVNNTFSFVVPSIGRFPKVENDNPFYPLQTIINNDASYYGQYSFNDFIEYDFNISSRYDEETVVSYNSVTFYSNFLPGGKAVYSKNIDGTIGNTESIPNLKIENNLLYDAINNAGHAPFALMIRTFYKLFDIKFINATVDVPYLPTLEMGDNILFETKNGWKVMPILLSEAKGSGQMRATISSNSNSEE